jgi:lipopolysaccharide biosynthesis glycosyltransferase
MQDRIHVCYCVNRKVLTPLRVSAFSAAESVSGENITIWIFHKGLTPQDILDLQNVLAPFSDVNLIVRRIDLSEVADLHGLHGEVIPLAKTMIPRLVREEVHRIAYLDADTIVIGGLDDLYRHNLEGNVLGAVSYGTLRETYTREFFRSKGLDLSEKAFNSGVLLIDVAAWNEKSLTREALDFLRKNSSKYDGADQASLNVVFYKRFFPLRIRYNKRAGPGSKLEDKHTTDGIIHFIGIPKPWDVGGQWLNKNYPLFEKHRARAKVSPRSILRSVREDGWHRTLKGVMAGLRRIFD